MQRVHVQLGDLVVPDSGYSPRSNGVVAVVVRTFVTAAREPNVCPCAECDGDRAAHWTEPMPAVELRVGKARVHTSAELGTFIVEPDSRRGLIARMRRDGQKRTARAGGVGSGRSDVSRATPSHRERDA